MKNALVVAVALSTTPILRTKRPGPLDAFGLPEPAPSVTRGVPVAGHRTVVFFERPSRLDGLCRALEEADLASAADLAVVVATRAGPVDVCGPATVVHDPVGQVAGAYGLRQPADAGPPVGYAVIDRHRQIRYRTLDPAMAEELGEVRTIVDATP